ncbi:TFIIE alpha subunit-domain-containing protein [Mycena floridula]|nr:TFIIE alpha subunit-domain-containing protein [Mycena floridula]
MATPEDQETLRLLVQHTVRAFYEPRFTIIMDQLARHPVLKDDDLASRMGLQPKELNKVIAILANDSLVKIYRQNELKEGAQRAVGRQYYYIDYEHFCNVVKWRMRKMGHKIDTTLRNELGNKGYFCPQCKATYPLLEANNLMDFSRGCFVCEICHAELEEAKSEEGTSDRMQRFNHQTRFVRAGLQKSESMVLPAFDVVTWVKTHQTAPSGDKSEAGAGLKIAGSDPNKKDDDGIGVVISTDKDEATRRQERDAEAEMKRQQNALPAWHLKSTISGDLTALGIQEHARAEAANPVLPSSNDDILRGLGVVGARPQPMPHINRAPVQDVKPVLNQEAEYFDQYYASLAASAVTSAQATPSGLSMPGSSDFDDFGNDEEEDKKPSIEYLNSLNDYKRKRSHEDDESSGKSKLAKTEEIDTNGVVPDWTEPEAQDSDMVNNRGAEEDPIVYVNGVAKPFSQVTDDDAEHLMTPEEYTVYFEVLQARS